MNLNVEEHNVLSISVKNEVLFLHFSFKTSKL